MSEPLSVSFPYSSDEHATALAETRTNRWLRRWIYFCASLMGLGMAVVTILGVAIADMPLSDMLRQTGPVFALAAGWFVVPTLLRRFQSWSLRRKRGPDTANVLTFTQDGFLGAPAWSQPVPWFLIERVVETRHYFLIYATPGAPAYLPKAVLDPVDVGRLRQLFTSISHAGTRFLPLRAT